MDQAFIKLFGIKDGFRQVEMAGRLDAWIVRDAMKLHNIGEIDLELFFDTYCKMLKDEMAGIHTAIPIPGIKALFQSMEGFRHIYHALGTGNIERGARIKLGPQGLNAYLPIGGYGDVALERWQIIEQAVVRSEVYYQRSYFPEDIYVIGDTPYDIACGKTLGVKTIAVATGSHDLEQLKKSNPDYLFANLEDQAAFFRIFNS